MRFKTHYARTGFRMTPTERELLEKASMRLMQTLSQFMRNASLAEAKKLLKEDARHDEAART